MIFSRDGSKLVAASSNSSIDVFDFDRCTGDLYNYKVAGEVVYTQPNRYLGCSISPSGNVLYTSSVEYAYKNVYQFDLTTSNVNSTKQTIISYPDTGLFKYISFGQHLLGPDSRIYIVKGDNFQGPFSNTYYTHHMDVILTPDNLGVNCNYQQSYFDLGNGRTIQSLPNMVNYNLGPVIGSICDSLSTGIQEQESGAKTIQFYPNPFTKEFSVHSVYPINILLKLYNELGELVYSKKINGNETIDVGFLPSGNYFIEAISDKNIFRKRLVKME